MYLLYVGLLIFGATVHPRTKFGRLRRPGPIESFRRTDTVITTLTRAEVGDEFGLTLVVFLYCRAG
jgi:hypothetical protein